MTDVIAISSTFPCDGLLKALHFWMGQLGCSPRVEAAPFNQVFQQLLDPGSLLGGNDGGINVVALQAGDIPERELLEAFGAQMERSRAPMILCFCPSAASGADEAEDRIASQLKSFPGIHLVQSREFVEAHGTRDWEFHGGELETAAFSEEFFAVLGGLIARKIHALRHREFKAVILDCDQTLWRGVCAEDIEVEVDAPRRALQEFILRQREMGLVVCLCSKNQEADVLRVLDGHPAMALRREHFTAVRANWEPKSKNVRALARELNIAMESLIFIDDDPVECAEVSAGCPEALTLQLPANPAEIPNFIARVWAFDRLRTTAEDKIRAEFYRENPVRESLRAGVATLDEFLEKLELKVEIRPASPADYSRLAQLSQRTTQLNFTTIHQTEPELRDGLAGGNLEALVVNVRDRFGKYGDVGLVIFESRGESLCVETFLLSCRALGRGVEQRMLRAIADTAQAQGLKSIEAKYLPTARNEPALKFLENAGAQSANTVDDGIIFRFRVDDVLNRTKGASVFKYSAPEPIEAEDAIQKINYQRIATEFGDLQRLCAAIDEGANRGPDLKKAAREVEAILRRHPDLREVAVRAYENGGPRLAAYVVAEPIRSPRIAGRARHVLPNNLAVVEHSRIETEALYREMFEQKIYIRGGIALPENACVIDAGANVGFFTIYAQSACPGARIFAFEPAPPTFELLRINAGLYAPKARLLNCGLSDHSGKAIIDFHPHLPGSSSYFGSGSDQAGSRKLLQTKFAGGVEDRVLSELTKRADASQRFETDTIALSDFLRAEGITQVHLLKVDVEKSEMNVLRGIRREDWPMIEQIVLEVHTAELRDQSAAYLKELGFTVVDEQAPEREGTTLSYLYATRPGKKNAALKSPIPAAYAKILGPTLLTPEQLRNFIKQKLRVSPAPIDIVFVDNLDDTFPVPTKSNASLDKAPVKPQNPLQEEIAGLWKILLGMAEVGIDENFFDLGGHSLLAAALLSRLQEAFGVSLPLASVFETPTIEGLSLKIEAGLIAQMDESELRRPPAPARL